MSATPAAQALIERLRAEHGPLMFHQSGGCCDGSAPMCFALGEFITGDADICLGEIAETRLTAAAAGSSAGESDDMATGPQKKPSLFGL